MESSQHAQSLGFQAINRSNNGSTLAARWIPKRGCVLRKVLKTIFKACLCLGSPEEEEAARPHFPNPSAVAPS